MHEGAHLLTLAKMAEELGLSLDDARAIVDSLKLPYQFALNYLPYWNASAKYEIKGEAIRRGLIPQERCSSYEWQQAMQGFGTGPNATL